MAELTWRDVAAPDFSGAMRGYQIAGDQITQAGKGLSDALGNFDTTRKNDAANAIYQASMNYKDPAALHAAMADGSLYAKAGVDPSLITADANKALDNRAGQLLNQSVTQTALDQSKQMNPLLVDQEKLKNQLAQGTLAANIAQPGLANASTAAQTARILQDNSQSGTRFHDEQVAQADELAAKRRAADIAQSTGSYAEGLGKIADTANGGEDDIDGGTRARMIANYPALYRQFHPDATDIPGSNGVSANGAGGGGAPGSAAAIGAQLAASVNPNLAGPSDSYNAMTRKMESGGNPNAHATTGSAGGLYGFTNDTWKGVMANHPELGLTAAGKMDPGQQEKAMQALTSDNSKSLKAGGVEATPANLRMAHFLGAPQATKFLNAMGNDPNADASSLFPKEAKANPTIFNGKTLGQVYAAQTAGFGGVIPPDLVANSQNQSNRAIELLSNIDTKTNQNNAAGIQGNYSEAMADTKMDMAGAVKKLQQGRFGNADPTLLAQAVRQVITQSKTEGNVEVNPATAAAILDRSSDVHSGPFGGLNPYNFGRQSIDTDEDAQTAELAKIGQGEAQKLAQSNAGHAALAAKLQAAMAAKNQAQNELFQAQKDSTTRQMDPAILQAKLDKYNRMSQAMETILRANGPNYKKDGTLAEGPTTPSYAPVKTKTQKALDEAVSPKWLKEG